MSIDPPILPTLTVNRSFLQSFIDAPAPCCAISLVEVQNRHYGFLALRPQTPIPPEVSAGGFSFGHSLYGNNKFEVIHFGFEFYGFQTYNVLINPNNAIVQSVLQAMIESNDYFFFSLDEQSSSVTTFRSDLGDESLFSLKNDWQRIQQSTTTEHQYRQAISHFAKKPYPPGILLEWVCGDDINYLDLTQDRVDLNPA
ncbi:MAG: hypothetical protein QNJ46_28400 [Leptolyngbyaceae cyanobacterium MO_188.B28]|nr:hypothetical protein [Leptolyngbyaceae cyanobacterium MO_188.B28]